MAKDARYDAIRPMFKKGTITTFSQIFKVVPPSVVAIDLGKGKKRFNELVKSPEGFTIQEINMLGMDCSMPLIEMAVLLEPECQTIEVENDKEKDFGYKAIQPLFEHGKLNYLEDIFLHVSKSVVAADIRINRGRFKRLMNNVQDFIVGEITKIGRLCNLTLPEMFKLVENQMEKQNKKS